MIRALLSSECNSAAPSCSVFGVVRGAVPHAVQLMRTALYAAMGPAAESGRPIDLDGRISHEGARPVPVALRWVSPPTVEGEHQRVVDEQRLNF